MKASGYITTIRFLDVRVVCHPERVMFKAGGRTAA